MLNGISIAFLMDNILNMMKTLHVLGKVFFTKTTHHNSTTGWIAIMQKSSTNYLMRAGILHSPTFPNVKS